MNNRKIAVVVSFAAGAVVAFSAAYLLLRPSLPSVQALRCDVPPNEFLSISAFEVKILNTDVKLPKPRKDAPQPRMASLQWRCEVKNISAVALHYDLKAELLDKDGFVLATGAVDGNQGQGELPAGQSHIVHDDVLLEFARARNLASARITPEALKTDGQMRQEKQTQLAQQMANLESHRKARENEWQQEAQQRAERDRLVKAEEQKRVDGERKRWKELKQGMTKVEVETLFGKPLSIRSFGSAGDWWEYPQIEGSYKTPRVDFSESGVVKGWKAP